MARPFLARASSALASSAPGAASAAAAAAAALSGFAEPGGRAEADEAEVRVLCVGRGRRPCDWYERWLVFKGTGGRAGRGSGDGVAGGGGGSGTGAGLGAGAADGGGGGSVHGGIAGAADAGPGAASGAGAGASSAAPAGVSSAPARSSSLVALERLLSRGVARAAASQRRPRRLLALLNPVSGRGAVPRLFREVALPAFAAAGVEVDVLETRRAGHAGEAVRALRRERIAELDGIVAAGGDGAFHELLDAVLDPASPPELRTLRLGHLPAGSTDAVACSLHGTRSFFAAVAHVCLGDAGRMDVMETSWWEAEDVVGAAGAVRRGGDVEAGAGGAGKADAGAGASAASGSATGSRSGASSDLVDRSGDSGLGADAPLLSPASRLAGREPSWSAPSDGAFAPAPPPGWAPTSAPSRVRHAACIAAAGFMGEICHAAELPAARRLGPLRYDLLGAWTVVRAPRARARVDVRASRLADSSLDPAPCGSACRSCAAGRAPAEPWRRLAPREWLSLMLIASPCISDKTPAGMARHAHLCDGRGWLVALPWSAGRLGMLKLLLALSSRGLAAGDPAEADIEPAEEAVFAADGLRLDAEGRAVLAQGAEPLRWNLDGEPHKAALLRCRMLHGAVPVFSRGVETTRP